MRSIIAHRKAKKHCCYICRFYTIFSVEYFSAERRFRFIIIAAIVFALIVFPLRQLLINNRNDYSSSTFTNSNNQLLYKTVIFPQGGGNVRWDQPWTISEHKIETDYRQFTILSQKTDRYIIGNLTFSPGLGNQMFQYAALRTFAAKHNATLLIPENSLLRRAFRSLSATFISKNVEKKLFQMLRDENISISSTISYDEKTFPACCRYYSHAEEELFITKNRTTPVTHQFIFGYFQSYKYFHPKYDQLIRSEFEFLPEILYRAQIYLQRAKNRADKRHRIKGKNIGELQYVGIHVRRGIDIRWNQRNVNHGHKIATRRYMQNAMNYYKKKYSSNVIFVVCSDDLRWFKNNMNDEFGDDFILVDSGYREVDLAVLSQCNHTIMTIGTFSWWAAFLAGGDVVYYSQWPSVGSILYQMFNQSDFFMNNWIAMD